MTSYWFQKFFACNRFSEICCKEELDGNVCLRLFIVFGGHFNNTGFIPDLGRAQSDTSRQPCAFRIAGSSGENSVV